MPSTAERLRRSQKQPQQQDPVPGRQLQREGRDLVACGDIARFPCCSLIRSSEAWPHCGHQQKCRYPQREKKLSKTQGDCKCGSGSGHSEGLQSRIVADAKHFKKHFVWSFSSKIPTYWSQHNVSFSWFSFHHPEFRGKKCSSLERFPSTAAFWRTSPGIQWSLAGTAGATTARRAALVDLAVSRQTF